MSDTDATVSDLERVQSFLDEKKEEDALEALNRIIDEQPTLEAHQMRLNMLFPNLTDPDLVVDSLNAVQKMDEAAYNTVLQEVRTHLYKRLETLRSEIADCRRRSNAQPHLQHLDRLTVLGDLFPIIHFARGIGYKEAAKLTPDQQTEEAGKSPLQIFEDILQERGNAARNRKKDVVPVTKDDEYVEWMSIAVDALITASQRMTTDSPYYGEVYELLGEMYEEGERLFDALEAYRIALESGRQVEQMITRMKDHIAARVQEQLLSQIDTLLARQELEKAAQLLEDYAPQPLTKSWRLRLAEVAMLRGNIDEAQTLYQQLIEDDREGK